MKENKKWVSVITHVVHYSQIHYKSVFPGQYVQDCMLQRVNQMTKCLKSFSFFFVVLLLYFV